MCHEEHNISVSMSLGHSSLSTHRCAFPVELVPEWNATRATVQCMLDSWKLGIRCG